MSYFKSFSFYFSQYTSLKFKSFTAVWREQYLCKIKFKKKNSQMEKLNKNFQHTWLHQKPVQKHLNKSGNKQNN